MINIPISVLMIVNLTWKKIKKNDLLEKKFLPPPSRSVDCLVRRTDLHSFICAQFWAHCRWANPSDPRDLSIMAEKLMCGQRLHPELHQCTLDHLQVAQPTRLPSASKAQRCATCSWPLASSSSAANARLLPSATKSLPRNAHTAVPAGGGRAPPHTIDGATRRGLGLQQRFGRRG